MKRTEQLAKNALKRQRQKWFQGWRHPGKYRNLYRSWSVKLYSADFEFVYITSPPVYIDMSYND